MPDLTGLPNITIGGRIYGAYYEDGAFYIDEINKLASIDDVLNHILERINGLSAGAALFKYQATGVNGAVDNGCFLVATIADATYERTGGSGQNTEGVLTIPEGGILRGVSVHFTATQAPGNTFYLNVIYPYTGAAPLVDGAQDNVMPPLATVTTKPATFTDGAPATNYIHSGTPIQIGIAGVNDNGSRIRIRYKIQNYNQQVGANASILSVLLP